MKTETEIRQALRDWIVKTNGKIRPEELTDETPIIEQRIISSLQVMDFILVLEKLSEKPIDAEMLKPGVFKNINTIYRNFFEPAGAETKSERSQIGAERVKTT